MSEFRAVQIQTTAPTQIVVRNANGKKIFDMEIHGVTVTVTTTQDAEINIEPDERRV